MKAVYFFLLTLTFSQAFAGSAEHFDFSVSTPKEDSYAQDRPFAIEYVISELSRVHKEIYALPFQYDYINETLMTEIVAKRNLLAPNYPSIEINDNDQELVHNTFKIWYAEHPQEFMDYLQFVEQYIAGHQ